MGVGRENLASRMAEVFSRMAPDTFLERFYFETISIHELAIDTIACFECCSGCFGDCGQSGRPEPCRRCHLRRIWYWTKIPNGVCPHWQSPQCCR